MKKLVSRLLSSKFFLVFIMLLYRVLIDLSYVYIISPNYAYAGLYLEINHLKLMESYLLLFVFSLILKHRINKPSDFFILFLFSLLAVPILSLFSLQDKSREFLYMVLLSFLTIIIASKFPQIKVPILHNGRKAVIFISVITCIFLFSWIISHGGLSYLNFNILKVYDFRRTVAEMVFSGRISYLMGWFGKVINPLMISFSLWKKNKMMIVLTIGMQVLFFAVTAHKSMLFYPVLIIFACIFGRKKYFGQMIQIGLAGVTAVSSIIYLINNNIIPISYFVRRTLFVVADLHYKYYDTFNELGFIYFSDKSWSPNIVEYPFNLPIPLVISEIYTGAPISWANAGFLATGYMHFGLAGMLVYSFIVGMIFRFIDYIAKWCLPGWLCIAIMITPIFSLTNADLLTALVTHGILLAIMLLWLMSGDIHNNMVNSDIKDEKWQLKKRENEC